MARTFEALMKAKKEQQVVPEESKIFDIRPQAPVSIPRNYKLPSQVAEEYHRMKQLIINANPDGKIKMVLFSSSREGEGTSTVTRDFAVTMASTGDSILLVDANARNPVLHDLFNLEKRDGLTELLTVGNNLSDSIKKTEVPNLSVITSGVPPSNPSSIFQSKLLDSLLDQMKQQADWVLFDAPPIHSYNDAGILATKLDGVIMVLEAESTRWEVAQSAKERIGHDKVKILGAVLNRRKMYIPGWAYRML